MTRKPAPSLEQHLKELEKIVEKMEGKNLSLEESLAHFERGIQLVRECQNTLNAAEQKIEILLKENEKEILAPFDNE